MKILKSDGTIEEGEPITDHMASFLINLEAYLHDCVCTKIYHPAYEGKRCQEAAQFLATLLTTVDEKKWGEMLREKINPPEQEAAPEQTVADAAGDAVSE